MTDGPPDVGVLLVDSGDADEVEEDMISRL